MNKLTNKKRAELIRHINIDGYSAEELPGLWHWFCATGPSRHYPKRAVPETTDNSLDFLI